MKFYLFLNRFLSTSAVRKQFSYPDSPGRVCGCIHTKTGWRVPPGFGFISNDR